MACEHLPANHSHMLGLYLTAHGLQKAIHFRAAIIVAYLAAAAIVVALVGPRLGTEIFPKVDAGQFQLRMHAATGSRIEHTEALTELRANERVLDADCARRCR